jgi:2-keto-4-pentenoate hydratase
MANILGDAMTEQLQRLDARLIAGMPRLGWKVGINVPEVQRQVGLTHALVGWLDGERSSMFHFGTVLGSWQPPRADIAIAADVALRVERVHAAPAREELVPAHLGDLVLFVAQQLAAAGRELQPGDLILSGCFVAKALPLRAGQAAEAHLGDFGSVSCHATQS